MYIYNHFIVIINNIYFISIYLFVIWINLLLFYLNVLCWWFWQICDMLDLRSRSRSTLRGWENLHLLDFTRLDLCRSASSNNNDNADTHEDASWVFPARTAKPHRNGESWTRQGQEKNRNNLINKNRSRRYGKEVSRDRKHSVTVK